MEAFHQKAERFGTIALLSNVHNQDGQQIFTSYKSRNTIEVMFDGIKNVLHADRTYMQNEDALQGWMFVNHIALQWYYIIYNLLKKHKQLKRYSVTDFYKTSL
jgi:transposase